MKSKTAHKFLEFLLENHGMSSVFALAILIAGIVTASVPLLILSGVFAYSWPLLYIYQHSLKDGAEKSRKPAAKRLTSIRPIVVGAR